MTGPVKTTAIAATAALAVFVSTFAFEYRPEAVEEIPVAEGGEALGDTAKILSWNLGYCGYDSGMDFFYDGGEQVRASEERTKANLDAVVEFLGKHRDMDFILLQEVDIDSKRSYGMNCLDSIRKALPEFTAYYAANFRCAFVPIPLGDPIGRVESGLVILTRHRAVGARRHRLPDTSSYPESVFGLKRCLLEGDFLTESGDTVRIFNVHNSAYDDGSRREAELDVIASLAGKDRSMFIGDWNCNPPGYAQSEKERTDVHFSPVLLDGERLGVEGYLADSGKKTMRYLDEPYVKGRTAESLLDFMAYTRGIEPVSVEVTDLGFRNSDHNPVLYRVVFSPEAGCR